MLIIGTTIQRFVTRRLVVAGKTALVILVSSSFHFLSHVDSVFTTWTPICEVENWELGEVTRDKSGK